jgi:hypothetical protein
MTETFPRSNRIERRGQVRQRLQSLGWSKKFFDDNIVLHDPADPYVRGLVRSDGTPIPRLKPVPLGGFFPEARLGADAVEFFSKDVEAFFDALLDARRAPYGDRRARPNRSRR